MFIGHYALALLAKQVAPRTSLGGLFAAAQLPDLIWPVCVLAGWETVEIKPGITAFNPLEFTAYPWSHSLLMVTVWGLVAGLAWWLSARDRTGAIVIALLVVSHWGLDWVAHRPDLPLCPYDYHRAGLGLWQFVAGTLVVEGGLFLFGSLAYLRATEPLDRAGRAGMPLLLGVLTLFYVADRAGTAPPSVTFLGWFALFAGALPIVWATWADRHRVPRETRSVHRSH